MSLESCMKKAGPLLNKDDKKAIRAIRDELLKTTHGSNREMANEAAVDEYIGILEDEKKYIITQVEALGGVMADKSLSPSEFSKRADENLTKAAKTFTQKGIHRPPTETGIADFKTGKRMTDSPENRAKATANMAYGDQPGMVDPMARSIELLTERTYKTVEYLYPDFYSMRPEHVLAIVNTFDPAAALGLAKSFGILPKDATELDASKYGKERLDMIHSEITGTDAMFVPDKSIANLNKDNDAFFHGWAGEVVADWITRNETLPLYYRVDDSFERDFVEAQPEHPLAIVTKFGKVIQEAEAAEPGPVRRLANKILDAGSMTIEATLGAVPQTKLPDFIQHGMEHVSMYTRTVKRMDNWMNTVIEGHHALAKRWLAFNRSDVAAGKMLGEFMHASTLAGVDVQNFKMPDEATLKKMNVQNRALWAKRADDYKALQPFWERLGKGAKQPYQRFTYNAEKQTLVPFGPEVQLSEAQAIYASVRDTYAQQRDMLVHNLEERINQTEADGASKAALITKLRQQFEAGLINPYFPLSRFGKHQATARTKDGEVVAFRKWESRRERNAWMEEMRKQGFIVEPSEEQSSDLEQMNKIDPGFVSSVVGLLDDTKVVDKDGKSVPGASIADQIWQMYLRTLPELSARKAYIHRIGRLGFTHDALRSFSDHSFHSTHQMAKLKFGHELSEHLLSTEEDAQILLQRADNIRNLMTGWRPKGMEGTSVHQAMWDSTIGGADYRSLYTKYKKQAGDSSTYHEASHIKARNEVIKQAEHDGPWAVPVANELKRRHAYNMNPKSAAWSTKLTALGFLWFLSTSPAAGVLNMTQTAISAYPALRAKFSGMGAGMELLKAARQYAGSPWLGMDNNSVNRLTNKLRNDKVDGKESGMVGERAAMEEFQAIGIFSKTRTRELMGLSEAGSAYSARQEQILEFTGYIFHKTEEMNRAVTALAAYRLARKKYSNNKSMSLQEQHNQAVLDAEELVEISHYDYTNTNRPRFMQGDMGRVVFLFRNYSLNMQYRLIRDFRDGIWKNENISKETRKEARTRFLGIIGMTTLFAGVGGWPLIWAAEMIANNLLGDDDDELYLAIGGDKNNPFDSKTYTRRLIYNATEKHIAEGWGEDVANAIMKGPWSAFTGTDLSTRASLNNLWVREIPENLKTDPQGLMMHLSGEMLGPIWGMGMNMAGGVSDFQQGHPDRGIEKLMPKFIGDHLKAIRYATQGAQTYNRDMILSPEQFTSLDIFAQAAGFTPTALSTRYEQNRAIKDMEMRLKTRRQDLMNRLFVAWRLEDRKTSSETLRDIAEWNRAQPLYPIQPDNIMQGARSRAEYDMRTVGGVAVDKRLHYLQEELRFSNRPE